MPSDLGALLADARLDSLESNFRSVLAIGSPPARACARALAELDRRLRRAPADPELLAAKGKLLSNLGNFEEARRLLGRSLSLSPERPLARAWLAGVELLDRRYTRAIQEASAALERDPDCAWARFFRAAALLVDGKPAQASADLKRVVERGPSPASDPALAARSLLALLEAQAGGRSAAERALGEVAASRPGEGWPLALRAAVRRGRGDLEGALQDLEAAARASPSAWLHAERATLLEAARKPGPALQALSAALSLEPEDPGLLRRRALLAASLGRWKTALADFGPALAGLGPGASGRDLALRLATALENSRRSGEATRVLRAALSAMPEDQELRGRLKWVQPGRPGAEPSAARDEIHRALHLMHQGRLKAAEAALKDARAGGPDGFAERFAWGKLRRFQGRLADAARAYREAARLDPRSLSVRLYWAEALLKQGATRSALRVLRDARRCPPPDPKDLHGLIDRYRLLANGLDFAGASELAEKVLDATRKWEHIDRLCWPVLIDDFEFFSRPPEYLALAVREAGRLAARRPGSPWGPYFRLYYGLQSESWVREIADVLQRDCALVESFPRKRYGWMLHEVGVCRRRLGELAGAARAFGQALRFTAPPSWSAQCELAEIALLLGDGEACLAGFERARRLAPDPGARAECDARRASFLRRLGASA